MLAYCVTFVVTDVISEIWGKERGNWVIFITIAFYGTMPVFPLIKGQYPIKVLIALSDTPFVYLVVILIRKGYPMGRVLVRK